MKKRDKFRLRDKDKEKMREGERERDKFRLRDKDKERMREGERDKHDCETKTKRE